MKEPPPPVGGEGGERSDVTPLFAALRCLPGRCSWFREVSGIADSVANARSKALRGRAPKVGEGRAPFVPVLCRARAKRQANDEVQADMDVRVDENRAASGDNSPRSSSTQARRTLRSIAGCSNSLGVIATTSKLSSASIEISPD